MTQDVTFTYVARLNYSTVKIPMSLAYNLIRYNKKRIPFIEGGFSANIIDRTDGGYSWTPTSYPNTTYFLTKYFVAMPFCGIGFYEQLNHKLYLYTKFKYEDGSSVLGSPIDPNIRQHNFSFAVGITTSFSK